MKLQTLILAAGLGWLMGCASTSSLQAPAMPPAPSGKVVVRDYVDSQKKDGVDEYFRILYSWDYDRQTAVMERFDMEGKLLERQEEPGLTLVTTDAELEYAIALVQHDPLLKQQYTRSDLHFHGGFSVREPDLEGCNEGSRCIRIFVSAGERDEIPVAKAIVDLASRRVIDRGDYSAQ